MAKRRSNRGREPRAARVPSKGKQPPQMAGTPTQGTDKERPVWSFAKVDMEGPFAWDKLSWSNAQDVLGFLQKLETMTWAEILRDGKKKHHAIEVTSLCKDAQDRLRCMKLDTIDAVVSLRVNGKQRIFVNRNDRVGQLLWWDPHHQVCPSNKKGT